MRPYYLQYTELNWNKLDSPPAGHEFIQGKFYWVRTVYLSHWIPAQYNQSRFFLPGHRAPLTVKETEAIILTSINEPTPYPYSHTTMIYVNRDRDNIIFTQLDSTTIIMSGYINLQVTEKDNKIFAVDPSGGPMLCVGDNLGMFVMTRPSSTPLTGIITKIEIPGTFVKFTVK